MTTALAVDGTRSRTQLEMDRLTDHNIEHYAAGSRTEIHERIHALEREWDIERVLKTNGTALALAGLVLGATVDRRWLALPGVALAFLLQQGVQGWCPPLDSLRRLGFRSRDEIDREKNALRLALEWP
ncbi:MAG TPA: hypothetical protein VEC35_11465 [Noviherbaspirillum sp.]|nr:hypothetical protein [Noviherbaspirillum sp.]